MLAMSEDGALPGVLQIKSQGRNVPVASLTVFAAMCILILFFAKTFEEILSFTIFLDCIGMATSAATIFVLRRRTKHLDGTGIFKMRFFPLQPLIFISAYVFVGISIAIKDYKTAVTGLSVLAAFLVIYFMSKGLHTKKVY